MEEQPKQPNKERRRGRHWSVRILKALILPFLCIAALGIGLVAGYVFLGGQPMDDVWKMETWRHLYDLVFAG